MREIDPQSRDPLEGAPQDPRLTRALRGLAASSRQGAPAELGAGLATVFRRHHARRRLVRRVSIGALAACLALAIGLMSLGSRPAHRPPAKADVQPQPSGVPEKAPEVMPVAKAVKTLPQPATKHTKPPKAGNSTVASRRQFLALPGYDPAVPADELHVVRVQLPGSALWQMGAPVSPDLAARKFMADFVVSQDGTPYAVRLVQ
ncbi:MAG TPA: hypothetical protein VFQ41_16090 [Candidatus Angelobacter sp.]|nr:hypothetical protein [Candidatus Angelobacter sp.]